MSNNNNNNNNHHNKKNNMKKAPLPNLIKNSKNDQSGERRVRDVSRMASNQGSVDELFRGHPFGGRAMFSMSNFSISRPDADSPWSFTHGRQPDLGNDGPDNDDHFQQDVPAYQQRPNYRHDRDHRKKAPPPSAAAAAFTSRNTHAAGGGIYRLGGGDATEGAQDDDALPPLIAMKKTNPVTPSSLVPRGGTRGSDAAAKAAGAAALARFGGKRGGRDGGGGDRKRPASTTAPATFDAFITATTKTIQSIMAELQRPVSAPDDRACVKQALQKLHDVFVKCSGNDKPSKDKMAALLLKTMDVKEVARILVSTIGGNAAASGNNALLHQLRDIYDYDGVPALACEALAALLFGCSYVSAQLHKDMQDYVGNDLSGLNTVLQFMQTCPESRYLDERSPEVTALRVGECKVLSNLIVRNDGALAAFVKGGGIQTLVNVSIHPNISNPVVQYNAMLVLHCLDYTKKAVKDAMGRGSDGYMYVNRNMNNWPRHAGIQKIGKSLFKKIDAERDITDP